ncbi:hypothetical protein BT96DRAFT_1007320 [Gymnopus androsaceus JB14]|uniref:Uncharacterized protein n=1 Tax=Gymnopus androsaceus JB14 TaxID=1447944 RepID=A0A6A4GHY2_9AGAR|nr:hypothetical protein BT96DRAFT_1007320 [Gymnopus androsaceus JB14]
MVGLNSRSFNSYRQPSSFFTSLEEAIQHVTHSAIPPPPSGGCVGPPGRGFLWAIRMSLVYLGPGALLISRVMQLGRLQVGPLTFPHLAVLVLSLRPSHEVQVIRGPTIHIPPPTQCPAPPLDSPTPSLPLRIGNVPIPPGSELARELEAFEAMEAEVASASQAHFFKEQEAACLAAAETKHPLESEQQCKDQRAIRKQWQENMWKGELVGKAARRQQRALGVQQWQKQQVGPLTSSGLNIPVATSHLGPVPTPPMVLPAGAPTTPSPLSRTVAPPSPVAVPIPVPLCVLSPAPSVHSPRFSLLELPDRWSPIPLCTWSPPRVLERPRLDGDAYHRTHTAITSGRDPAVTDLWDAYGDSHRLGPLLSNLLGAVGEIPLFTTLFPTASTHLSFFLPLMPILQNTNIGALQQELLDMQWHLNSTQLDLGWSRLVAGWPLCKLVIWKRSLQTCIV